MNAEAQGTQLLFPTGVGQSDTHAPVLSDGRPNPHQTAGTDYSTITGREIAVMVETPQAVPKAEARWFLPSVYVACDARDHSVQRERGEFWWLCIDVDQNNLDLADIAAVLEAVAPGASQLVYSTRSSTADARRWRALLPLLEPVFGRDYTDTVLAFYAILTEASTGMLIPDPKLALTGQLIYLPNRGSFYQHDVFPGTRLDLTPDHPVIRRRDGDRAAADAARQEAAERRARNAAERPQPGDGETPVDRFNAAHAVADLLERNGYVRLGQTDNWRSPHQTSGHFATRDFGDHWVSLSGSDAAAEIGAASRSGSRFGDAFDLFVHFEHDGNFEAAVRAYGDECRQADGCTFTRAGGGQEAASGTTGNSRIETVIGNAGKAGGDGGEDATDDAPRDGGSRPGDGDGSGHDDVPKADLRLPTTFVWRDPSLIPPRPWLYGRHLLRRQVSVTVAPGGVGKSSLTIVEALAMVTGRRLLGDWVAGNLLVWLLNLEDPADELERRIAAAMEHHGVGADALGGRLFMDSGRDRPLCTASQLRAGVIINVPELDAMTAEIWARQIDVLIVDPFVSSHAVNENDNGAIDMVAKQFWAALAQRCNCAVELVHHTRKLGGEEGTSEAGRGASALLGAARSGRVLNRMTKEEREKAGVPETDACTYFAVTRDKANLAPPGKREWRRIVPVELANGDSVGVVEAWTWPDDFEGVSARDLLAVQRAIADSTEPLRYSDQSNPWVGNVVARTLTLDPVADRKRVKRMIEVWLRSGALVKCDVEDDGRKLRPCVSVGEWASE